MEGWSRAEKLALSAVILALIGLAFLFPPVRAIFGIDKPDVVVCLHSIEQQGLFDVGFSFDLLNKGSAATTVTAVHFDITGIFNSVTSSTINLDPRQDIDAGKSTLTPITVTLNFGDVHFIKDISTLVYWSGGQGTPFQNMANHTITNPPGCP